MDIQEIMQYSKNKVEADDLTKQVRQRIKETAWEKQNRREGFSETFKPLISHFEKPEDSKKENIFTQNQKMLRNQLALTEGLKDNQQAITKGFSQFERLIDMQDRLSQLDRLADMQELPGVEAIEDDEDKAAIKEKDKDPIAKFNVKIFDKYLNNKKTQDILEKNSYIHLPSYYFDKDISEISTLIGDVNTDLEIAGDKIKNTAIISYNKEGYNLAKPLAKNPKDKTIEYIEDYNALSIY